MVGRAGAPAGSTGPVGHAPPRPLDLGETLQMVADTIVASLGFEVAVINLVVDDDSTVVAAVCGPDEVREALLSRRQGRAGWQELLEAGEPWGRLRFLDHARSVDDPADILSWVPDMEVSDDPEAWHPEDALFAMLEGAGGEPLGVLSVDVPRDGLRPGPATCRALEALAVTAALAVQHADLAAQSRVSVRRFQGVFDASPVAIGLVDADGRCTLVNDAFCSFLRRAREDLLGSDLRTYVHPDDAASVAPTASAPAREQRWVLPDGSVVWGRLHVAALGSSDEPDVLVVQVEDVTERKHAEELLVQQAHFDPLTSLPNRARSLRALQARLDDTASTGGLSAVFFCDLDGLKAVNDAYGHAVGDEYLRLVGLRLRAAVREGDLVGRLGGDEFVVVLDGVASAQEAVALAERLDAHVRRPMRLACGLLTPTVSVGIAVSGDRGTSAGDLLARADGAMYVAKASGGGTWRLHAA